MCYIQCYLACLERCIKFLNKNAYIQIALSGKSFCFAAKDAFFFILSNMMRVATVNFLSTVFCTLGLIFITIISTLAGYFI